MFKSIKPHIITGTLPDFVTLEKALQQMPFDITTGQETKSVGWVPPRSDGGLFVESVNSQLIMRFMAETRQVPASVVQSRVDEMVSEWEATTGRKPGKKERRDLKEQAVAELLPNHTPDGWPAVKQMHMSAAAAELRRQHAEIDRLTDENEALRAKIELIDYVLQDNLHNRLTPRVVDIAYSAFTFGRRDTPHDWFNDTKPMVMEQLAKIQKHLAEEAAHGIGEKP